MSISLSDNGLLSTVIFSSIVWIYDETLERI